jgi:hypothetical protein
VASAEQYKTQAQRLFTRRSLSKRKDLIVQAEQLATANVAALAQYASAGIETIHTAAMFRATLPDLPESAVYSRCFRRPNHVLPER